MTLHIRPHTERALTHLPKLPTDDGFADLPHGSKVLFESSVVQIGATRCAETHPDFARPGPIQRHAFYLGGSPVRVLRHGRESFLADATTVSFHHQGDEPERQALRSTGAPHGKGDYSNWFAVSPEHLIATLGEIDPSVAKRTERPFLRSQGPCTPKSFLVQRLLVDELSRGFEVDALRIEETALELLVDVSRGAGALEATTSNFDPAADHHTQLIHATKELLSEFYRSRFSLAEIAREVGCSPFHLARLFRAHTGWSLHGFRTQVRLRGAADAILDGESDLTQLALELGFSSHSHLTSAFKKTFGVAPSSLREGSRRTLEKLVRRP